MKAKSFDQFLDQLYCEQVSFDELAQMYYDAKIKIESLEKEKDHSVYISSGSEIRCKCGNLILEGIDSV